MKNLDASAQVLSAQLSKGSDTVHPREFAGGIAQEMANLARISSFQPG